MLLLIALHGKRLHAEEFIRTMAAELRAQVSVCHPAASLATESP